MMRKLALAFILLACSVAVAAAGTATYQYKDNTNGLFNILIWSACGAPTQFCTGMVLEDSSGVEKFTTANPGTIDTGVSGNLINAIKSPPALGTSGGWTPLTKTGLTTTPTVVKASAGQLGFAQCDNTNGSMVYVQIFNLASGSVSLGSTAPTQVLPIPANLSNGFVMNLVGMQYSTAITVAATTTATGSSAPGSALNCTFGYN